MFSKNLLEPPEDDGSPYHPYVERAGKSVRTFPESFVQTVTIRSQVSRPFENDLALLCEALKAPAVFDDLNAELCLKLLNGDGKGRLRNFLEIMGPASQHALVYPRTRRRSHDWTRRKRVQSRCLPCSARRRAPLQALVNRLYKHIRGPGA